MQCERVVIINDFSSPNGGASAIAYENAIQVSQLGIPVTFISADGGECELANRPNIDCVSLEGDALDPDEPLKGMLTGLHNAKAKTFMRKWIEKYDQKGTVYHVHCWSKIFSPSLFLALKPVVNRLVIHGHDYFPACPNGAYVHYPSNKDCNFKPGSISCLSSQCDQRSYLHKLWRFGRGVLREQWVDFRQTQAKLVLLHESMREYFLRADFASHNLKLIANPVRPYADKRFKAEENTTFVFIGRVVPEKGVDTFLTAVTQLGLPAKVIGDGESLTQLKQDYPQVTFTGWQNQSDIVDHLASARVVVMPSKVRETFGLVSVESLGSGLPVIVSDKSPLAKDIEQFGMGYQVQPDNVENLVQKMQQLAKDSATVQSMSEKGFSEWQRLALTPQRWGQELHKLYKQLLEEASN